MVARKSLLRLVPGNRRAFQRRGHQLVQPERVAQHGEEAEFFLANCPGVKMDGGGDGVPCEKQWCGDR